MPETEPSVRVSCTTKAGDRGEGRVFEGRPVGIKASEDGTWLELEECEGAFSHRLGRLGDPGRQGRVLSLQARHLRGDLRSGSAQ